MYKRLEKSKKTVRCYVAYLYTKFYCECGISFVSRDMARLHMKESACSKYSTVHQVCAESGEHFSSIKNHHDPWNIDLMMIKSFLLRTCFREHLTRMSSCYTGRVSSTKPNIVIFREDLQGRGKDICLVSFWRRPNKKNYSIIICIRLFWVKNLYLNCLCWDNRLTFPLILYPLPIVNSFFIQYFNSNHLTRWINLQMKGYREMTALQYPVYWNKQISDTIRDNVSDAVWIQLLSTPLTGYNQRIHYELEFQ